MLAAPAKLLPKSAHTSGSTSAWGSESIMCHMSRITAVTAVSMLTTLRDLADVDCDAQPSLMHAPVLPFNDDTALCLRKAYSQ